MRSKKVIVRRWAVRFSSERDSFLVGFPWLGSGSLPDCVLAWPAAFQTRAGARGAAKMLTERFSYLRPTHVWKFRAQRLVVTVSDGGSHGRGE